VSFISTEIITRVFNLQPIVENSQIDYESFRKHRSAVNKMIKEGIKLEGDLFENESLAAVKKFYTALTRNVEVKEFLRSLEIKERLIRCAAQYAYFSIRNSKHTQVLIRIIADSLSKSSSWSVFGRQKWDYWELPIKKSRKFKGRLDQEILKNIETEYLKLFSNRVQKINSTIVQNYFFHIKKS